MSVELNIGEIIKPLLLSAVLKGEDIGPVVEALISEKITSSILDRLVSELPPEYRDIGDILRTAAELDSIRAAMAVMRGESYEPRFSIDKVIEMIVTLKMMSALETALGGSSGGAGGAA